MTTATNTYRVINVATGQTLGAFLSISERGAKIKASRVNNVPYGWLKAILDEPKPVEVTSAPKPARDLSRFAMSFPVINGEVVTQGHADYCMANGHATHTANGVVAPFCPRCGLKTEQAAEALADWERALSALKYTVTDRDGNTVKAGDRIVDFRGNPATFVSVTRGAEYNGTPKVLVRAASGWAREFYATVYDLEVVTK